MHWVRAMLGGDFGTSIFAERPVLNLISQRLEPTLSISILTMILSATVGVSFGVLAAWSTGGFVDRVLTAFSAVGYSVPIFVIGYFLVYFFAIMTRWLPVQGYMPIDNGIRPWFVHLILPTIALSLGYIAYIARIARASPLDARRWAFGGLHRRSGRPRSAF